MTENIENSTISKVFNAENHQIGNFIVKIQTASN